MTDQNNAAQPVLTDEEINAACCRSAADTGWHAENDRKKARAVESALLSKLRAPVADEPIKQALKLVGELRKSAFQCGVCPDSGTCHHGCVTQCARQHELGCVPLGASGLGDDWKLDIERQASAPVADESPLAKMAETLREKARQEQQAYQDRRAQSVGAMPVAHVAGDDVSRFLEWAKDRSAWEMPVGTPLFYGAALASAPLAGEAQEPVAWMRGGSRPEWADTEPETDGWTPLYASPQASEAVREFDLAEERAAFESRFRIEPENWSVSGGGGYRNIWYETRWEGWKARAALSAQPGAQKEQDDA